MTEDEDSKETERISEPDCKHYGADQCTLPDGGECMGKCDQFEPKYKFLKKCRVIDKSKCRPIGFFGKGTTGEQIVGAMIEAMQEEVGKEKVVEAKKKNVEGEK